MAKEKIKVSLLIDKQAVLDCAFRNAKNEEEYNQIKEIIEPKDEIVRDIEKFFEEEGVDDEMTEDIAPIAIDELLWQNKDLLMSKRKTEELEAHKNAEQGGATTVKAIKLNGDKAKAIAKMLGLLDEKED